MPVKYDYRIHGAYSQFKAKRAAANKIGTFFLKKKSSKSKYPSKYFEKGSNISESKYITTIINTAVPDSTAYYSILLNGIAQGVAQNQRIGQKVKNTTIQLTLIGSDSLTDIVAFQNGNNQPIVIRVALVHDKMSGQALPNLADVWELNATNVDPMALRNQQFIEKYSVLMDRTYMLDQVESSCFKLQEFLKVGLETHYTGTTASVTSVSSGTISLFMWSNVASITGQAPVVEGFVRVKYTDD